MLRGPVEHWTDPPYWIDAIFHSNGIGKCISYALNSQWATRISSTKLNSIWSLQIIYFELNFHFMRFSTHISFIISIFLVCRCALVTWLRKFENALQMHCILENSYAESTVPVCTIIARFCENIFHSVISQNASRSQSFNFRRQIFFFNFSIESSTNHTLICLCVWLNIT